MLHTDVGGAAARRIAGGAAEVTRHALDGHVLLAGHAASGGVAKGAANRLGAGGARRKKK